MNSHTLLRGLACATITSLAVAAVPVLAATAASAAGTVSLVATSADGDAFDVDEIDAGDLTVQVTDSVSGAVDVDDTQDLRYHWAFTPFDPAAPAVRIPAAGKSLVTDEVAGEFVVPMPPAPESGTYVLVAALKPDAAGNGATRRADVLTLAVGEAELTFTDGDALQAPPGSDRTVTGALTLADGTGLAGRLVDLTYVRGSAGSDPTADAGFVPALPDTTLVTTLQVTTDPDGSFEVVVRDPAEDGQGSELGGRIDATTAPTPGVGDAGAAATLAVDLVSDVAPAGSTLTLAPLGAGTPGQALPSVLTVTAPDDTFDVDPGTPGLQGDADTDPDPVEGQPYSLSLDHGFFTTGDEQLPSTVGDPAGTLVGLGDTLTGLTDADGKVSFAVAIERDRGFDDDGLVTATVSAVAGDLTEDSATTWDSTDPLNGGAVELRVSPKREQPGAVDPTVAGNRTYYDVFSLDQFGNPVRGEAVELTYSGDLDDWDYSTDFLVTDLDRSGDLWVVSYEAADIEITGTWLAPTRQYADTAGNAVTGTADVTGSSVASYYDLDFAASKIRIKSSVRGVAEVGTAVTETVKVRDQLGNPVEGYQVRFYRLGPDSGSGEPQLTTFTNRRGQASYTFVGTGIGTARISAEVSDGIRSLTRQDRVRFGAPVRARLSARGHGRGNDTLQVTAPSRAAGATVRLYRVGKHHQRAVGRGTLNASGKAGFRVRDRNGKRRTTYVAVVRSTRTTVADTTNTRRVR